MRELKQNWTDIFRGFRLGLDIWRVSLAFAGLVISFLAIGGLRWLQHGGNWIPLGVAALAVWLLLLLNTLRSEEKFDLKKAGVLVAALLVLAGLVLVFEDLSETAVLYVGGAVLLTLIWGVFGGAITRSALVELATDERIGMMDALRYACGRYRHYVWSILAPIAGILFFLLLMTLGAWIARVPVLDILVSLTVPLYFLAGFIIMLILVGLVVGWPLLFPAIGAEGSDSFDAISRVYSYIYTKPWRYLWYHLVALGYAGAVIFFVKLFALGLVGSVDKSLEFGMGDEDYTQAVRAAALDYATVVYAPVERAAAKVISVVAQSDVTGGVLTRFVAVAYGVPALRGGGAGLRGTQHVVAFLVGLGLIVFVFGVVAFAVSLSCSLHSIIYLLMRKDVDGTDMTEVFQEEEAEEEDYLARVAVPGEEEGEKEEAEAEAEEAEAPPAERAEPEEAKPEEKAEEKPKRRRTTRRRTTRPTTRKKKKEEPSEE